MTTAPNCILPTSDEERRVALVYLASLAVRPVEGHDDPTDWDPDSASRSALVLRLTPVSEAWAEVSGSLDVRRALKRTGKRRTLGARGFLKTVRDISSGSRAENQARRRALRAAALQAQQDAPAEFKSYRYADLPDRFRLDGPDREPLGERVPDDDCPVSLRQHGSAEHVRIRRDVLDSDGATAWEHLADRFTREDPGFEDLIEEALLLGFTLTDPIPSAWVQRVEPDDEDDGFGDGWGDDDDDDQADDLAPAPAVEPAPSPPAPRVRAERPAFLAPPLPPMADDMDRASAPRPAQAAQAAQAAPLHLTTEQTLDLRDARRDEALEEKYRRQWSCANCGEWLHRYSSLSAPSDLIACHNCRRRNAWRKRWQD